MKVVGLITEYNPFHNGHKYHIEEARRITGADYVVAVMSGNFVQRGAPAIIDKYSRTRMALMNGVDLVIELPVCYASASAEYFAHGAVSVLNSLNVVDYLCFGSEAGDIDLLLQAADLLLTAPSSYDEQLKVFLKEGSSYPAARQKALEAIVRQQSSGNQDHFREETVLKVLSEPNNILGIEYLRAIHRLSASLLPLTIKREVSHYHETTLSAAPVNHQNDMISGQTSAETVISSATAIRTVMTGNEIPDEFDRIKESVPADVYQILVEQNQKTCPVTEELFAPMIKYRLMTEDRTSLSQYLDISGDLADRMKNLTDLNCSITELANRLKTRNVTLTRINRALIHLLLGTRMDELEEYKARGYASYVRILGMRKHASPLVKRIRRDCSLPVITKLSYARKELDAVGLRMLSQDIFAAHLYNQAVYEKYQTPLTDEYRHGIIII